MKSIYKTKDNEKKKGNQKLNKITALHNRAIVRKAIN